MRIKNVIYLCIIGSILLLIDGCRKTNVEPSSGMQIGQSYQGGKIVYLLQPNDPGYDPYTTHGLIIAPYDQSAAISWNNDVYSNTGATGNALGAGKANTDSIVANLGPGNYAAYICDTLTLGGYTDWYLPSDYELTNIAPFVTFINIDSIFGLVKGDRYWSSTESYPSLWTEKPPVRRYALFEEIGVSQLKGFNTESKGDFLHVRAFRRF